MIEQVEISEFDLRYQDHRMKSVGAEKALLWSILEQGIRDPLQGVDGESCRILLNGFKRYRCAKKLGIQIVPYCSLGGDEALGIMEILRISNARSLSILEQAKLIDGLQSIHHMSVSEIAHSLEKSKAWVSVRAGMIREMSPRVMERVFEGQFPVYAYMYTLRRFMRINRIPKEDMDAFVDSVCGKHVSLRDIDLLAHGYFNGSAEFRDQIKSGNVPWVLSRMKESFRVQEGCSDPERRMLKDLEIVQKYMSRVTSKSKDCRLKSNAFYAEGNLLAAGILRQLDLFKEALKHFYDRSGQA